MSKPDPASALGPSPVGSVTVGSPSATLYALVLAVSTAPTAKGFQFQPLPSGSPISMSFTSDGPQKAGVVTGSLTFTSNTGHIALVSTTCSDEITLGPGQSCMLIFDVSPGGRTSAAESVKKGARITGADRSKLAGELTRKYG